jgi:hypothetical protein
VAKPTDPPVVLIKWYDFTKWLLDRVDSFPKNQRFIFGQRLADYALDIMELLVDAAYSPRKSDLLATANRKSKRFAGCYGWQRSETCSAASNMSSAVGG